MNSSDLPYLLFATVVGAVCGLTAGALKYDHDFDLEDKKVEVFEEGLGDIDQLCANFNDQMSHLATVEKNGQEYVVVPVCVEKYKAHQVPYVYHGGKNNKSVRTGPRMDVANPKIIQKRVAELNK